MELSCINLKGAAAGEKEGNPQEEEKKEKGKRHVGWEVIAEVWRWVQGGHGIFKLKRESNCLWEPGMDADFEQKMFCPRIPG